MYVDSRIYISGEVSHPPLVTLLNTSIIVGDEPAVSAIYGVGKCHFSSQVRLQPPHLSTLNTLPGV